MDGISKHIMPPVAYFSMEIGLELSIPTYSGGLGVLAGDTLRSAADLGLPMTGVTLLHRKGYFRQHLDRSGNQTESPEIWNPAQLLEPSQARAEITVEGRQVHIRAWRYTIRGIAGHTVPIYLLDTYLNENAPWDRTLTDYLYGGDDHYRLCQELVLGYGGVGMLKALGYDSNVFFHMNEGHSALLVLALLDDTLNGRRPGEITEPDIEGVRQRSVFTTHTPVPAGHDKFPPDLVKQVLGPDRTELLQATGCCIDGMLNMTYLALRFARYINGVAMTHGEVSLDMFPNYPINAITNGIHAATWISKPFRELFDREIPEWKRDNLYLRYAIGISLREIIRAHSQAKRFLIDEIERRTGISLSQDVLTIGFARRATTYKRPDLLFSDLERLKRAVENAGPLQVVYSGKAHPRDEGGKEAIRRVFQAATALKGSVPVIYLENYNMAVAEVLVPGVDLWLNTPQKPQEASGTSGMKAALNGVPSFSVLDGWWVEGHIENVTGWSIGERRETGMGDAGEISSLYNKLEHVILPMFYHKPESYAQIMRYAIALNSSFFNTQRMVSQYLNNAYLFPTV